MVPCSRPSQSCDAKATRYMSRPIRKKQVATAPVPDTTELWPHSSPRSPAPTLGRVTVVMAVAVTIVGVPPAIVVAVLKDLSGMAPLLNSRL